MSFIHPVVVALLALACGCGAQTAIPDPQSCEPGTRLYLCRYYTSYADAYGKAHPCYDPTLGRVCVADTAPDYGFPVAQAAYRAEYGNPYPSLDFGVVDCELELLYVTPSWAAETCP
jgi:hypothetical protein